MTTLEAVWERAFAEGWFSHTRKRPMKSAVERYATLLGYADAKHCPLGHALHPQSKIQEMFETHAKPGLLPESIANQWRSVWNLLEMATVRGCAPALPTTDEHDWRHRGNLRQASRVHQHRWDGLALGRYGLTDWPIELAHDTYNYVAWCQKPLARGRPARIQKVESTAGNVYVTVGQVAGYAVQQRGMSRDALSLAALCEPTLLEDFAWWWIGERRHLSTETILSKLGTMHTIARHWLKDAETTAKITAIFHRLKEEAPVVKVVDKQKRWLPLEHLDRIARSTNPRSESRMRLNKMVRYVERHLSDPLGHPLPPSWQPGYVPPRPPPQTDVSGQPARRGV